MNTHLSAQEFVEAMDGTLREARRAHLASCDVCTREVAELSVLVGASHDAGAVPEPSPLFWEHFSARVAAATETEPIRPLTWWDRAWRPVVVAGAVGVAAVLALMVFNGRTTPSAPAGLGGGEPTSVAVAVDEESLELMVQMATDVSNEDLQSARPGQQATAGVIDDLTPAQQAEFIRLIKAEIGDQQ